MKYFDKQDDIAPIINVWWENVENYQRKRKYVFHVILVALLPYMSDFFYVDYSTH